jgi:hypothetical protein
VKALCALTVCWGVCWAGAGTALAATSGVWELTSYSDFIKGNFEGVSLGRDGRLSLAPRLDTLFASEQPVIWSVIKGPDSALYAATGHRGRVFRIDASGKASVLWTGDRPEIFAIAIDKRGVLYAASSPDGKIYRIENGKAQEYFDPKTKYIWSLAVGPDGSLYAGTGEGGRIFRITAAGQGGEYYATGQSNVTSLLVDAQGRLLAGTEPNGILYRITARDKAFVLYDASLPEIRAILPAADGSIYAAGLGGALAKKEQAAQQAAQNGADSTPTVSTTITVTADSTGGDLKPNPPEPKQPQQTAPAAATPQVTAQAAATAADTGTVEKSAIYRINPDNTVDTLWSSKEENVYDVLPASGGGLYFGTDENGRIYELSRDRRLTLVAQTNEAEAIRLLDWRGALLAATANMGKIYKLGGNSGKGSYQSPVFDAGAAAQWGKLKWRGEGTVAMRTRSGNSLRPDNTWSDWSAPVTAAGGSQIASPAARFLQFSAELSTPNAAIEYVTAAYLPQNNPPTVRSITVLTQTAAASSTAKSASNSSTASAASAPYTITVTDTGDTGPVASTGTPTQTLSRAAAQQLLISWQADDPDGDKLVYDVQFRGDGERDWKFLRRNLHDNSVTIDGDSLADGRYFFKVTASDREANPPASAKEGVLVSSPVLIDNTPPVIRIESSARKGTSAEVIFEARDDQSALRRAEWSIDAGPWTPFAPVDGILDSQTEQFRLEIPNAPAGEHLLVIRVADSGNNTALAKVVLR